MAMYFIWESKVGNYREWLLILYAGGSKEKGKYQKSMQSSTAHDLCHPWESDTIQGNITQRGPIGQPYHNK